MAAELTTTTKMVEEGKGQEAAIDVPMEMMQDGLKSHLHTLWKNGYLQMSSNHVLEYLLIDGTFVNNIHRDSETKAEENIVVFNVDLLYGSRTFRASIETKADDKVSEDQIDTIEFASYIEVKEFAPVGGYKSGECKENTIPFCRYCKCHGHMIKMEKNGRVICPRLLVTQCQKCGHCGHTTNSCKLPAKPVSMMTPPMPFIPSNIANAAGSKSYAAMAAHPVTTAEVDTEMKSRDDIDRCSTRADNGMEE